MCEQQEKAQLTCVGLYGSPPQLDHPLRICEPRGKAGAHKALDSVAQRANNVGATALYMPGGLETGEIRIYIVT